jgi:hypothetical protein
MDEDAENFEALVEATIFLSYFRSFRIIGKPERSSID